MYNYEDFKTAFENVLENEHDYFPDGSDVLEMIKYNRQDIFSLKEAFEDKYGFELLDIEIQIIWKWHSVEWDASWLIVGENPSQDMVFFDEFVERFK